MHLRPGAEHARRPIPSYGTRYIHQRARAVRARATAGLRELRRHAITARRASSVRALLRRRRPVHQPVGRLVVLARRVRARFPARCSSTPIRRSRSSRSPRASRGTSSSSAASITCSPSAPTSARPRPTCPTGGVHLAQDLAAGRDWTSGAPTTPPGDRFTTVMTWQIESFTDVDGNKDQEFVRFIDLPSRTPQPFELAINGPQRAAARARLGDGGRDGRVAHAVGLSRLHPALEGRVRRRQAHLRREPLGLVQRPHRVLPGRGPSGAGAGHRVERAPAVGQRAARRSRRPTRRSPASTRIDARLPARMRGAPARSRASTSTRRACCRALLEIACG